MNTELVFAAVQSASLARDLAGTSSITSAWLVRPSPRARLVVFPELSLTGYELAFGSEHPVTLGDERLAPLRVTPSR